MLEALALTFGNFIKGISQLKVKSAMLKVESGGRKSDGLKLITLTNPRNNSETTFYFPLYTFNYSDTGLMYFGARFYDPQLGRFITEDPAGPNFKNPFSLNRYHYAYNNPMLFVDPDGRFFFLPALFAAVSAVVGAAATVAGAAAYVVGSTAIAAGGAAAGAVWTGTGLGAAWGAGALAGGVNAGFAALRGGDLGQVWDSFTSGFTSGFTGAAAMAGVGGGIGNLGQIGSNAIDGVGIVNNEGALSGANRFQMQAKLSMQGAGATGSSGSLAMHQAGYAGEMVGGADFGKGCLNTGINGANYGINALNAIMDAAPWVGIINQYNPYPPLKGLIELINTPIEMLPPGYEIPQFDYVY